jgi:hypothetical protein
MPELTFAPRRVVVRSEVHFFPEVRSAWAVPKVAPFAVTAGPTLRAIGLIHSALEIEYQCGADAPEQVANQMYETAIEAAEQEATAPLIRVLMLDGVGVMPTWAAEDVAWTLEEAELAAKERAAAAKRDSEGADRMPARRSRVASGRRLREVLDSTPGTEAKP